MVLRHYKIQSVGPYKISQDSGGSALGQLLCDRLKAGTARTSQQPLCANEEGPLQVYHQGHPTEWTREAYPKGTFLPNVQGLWLEHGIHSTYKRSVTNLDNTHYLPNKLGKNFDAMLTHLHKGHPAIFHVTPRRKRGGGHYLLAIGYNDIDKELYYIDPNPVGDDTSQGTVSFAKMRSGTRWFRERYFFTGRFLAVTHAPTTPTYK